MRKIVKKAFSVMMATMMIATLAGCGEKESTTANVENQPKEEQSFAGKTLALGVWGGNEQESAAINKMVQQFEQETGSKIDLKIYTDYNTQIQADFIAGTAPDAFYIDASMFPFYSQLGVMEPLDGNEMGASNYYENLLGAFTAEDGTLYCIPKDVSTLATYCNTQLLESVGVAVKDIPNSLEEYKDFLVDLQEKLDKKYGKGQIAAMTYNQDLARNLYILEASGESIVDESGKAQLSKDKVAENFQFLVDLAQSGAVKTPADLGLGWNGEAFGVGKTAIMEEGNWVYGLLKKDYQDIAFEVKDMPTYKGQQYSMSFTVGWGVSSVSKEKELAKEWIRYATGVEGMKTWVEGAGCLPSRADVAQALNIEQDPVWSVHSKMIDVAIPWQKGTTIDIVNNAYKNFVPAAFKGEESAKSALEKVDNQANSEIANAQ